MLDDPNVDSLEVQEKITSAPKYDSSTRKDRKYNKEIDEALNQILMDELKKDFILGWLIEIVNAKLKK